MTVTVDVVTESVRTATTDPWTWSHAGTTPEGVLVTIIKGVSATDVVTSVTYGGVALTRVQRNTDTVTEAGSSDIWFRGSGIPAGTQTVSVDLTSALADDIHFVSITLNGTGNLEVVDSDGINNDVANPQRTLQYGGRTCMAFSALYSGGTNVPVGALLTGMSRVHDHDFGAHVASVERQTTAGSTDFTIGLTLAIDDVAFSAVAISEMVPANLVIANGSHAHTGQNAAITATSDLAVANAIHAHGGIGYPDVYSDVYETLALTQTHVLEVAGASHAQVADNLDLDQVVPSLVIANASHAHSAGAPTLLTLQPKAWSEPAMATTLTGELVVSAGSHGHTAEAVVLTQAHELLPAAGVLAHTADQVSLTQDQQLTVAAGTHAHTAETVALSQIGDLGVAAGTHAHTTGALVLTQVHTLAIAEGVHGFSSDNVALSTPDELGIQEATHIHTAAQLVLTQEQSLVVQGASHASTSDQAVLTEEQVLVVQDAIHAQVAETLLLNIAPVMTISFRGPKPGGAPSGAVLIGSKEGPEPGGVPAGDVLVLSR